MDYKNKKGNKQRWLYMNNINEINIRRMYQD